MTDDPKVPKQKVDEPKATLQSINEKNEEIAKKAVAEVLKEWNKRDAALLTANAAEADAKVKIGKYLVRVFFNKDWKEVWKENPVGKRQAAWNMLLKDPKFPIRAKTTRHNILKCGGQAYWAEEKQIDLSGLNFTVQVYLTRLPNDEAKMDVIAEIKAGTLDDQGKNRSLTSRETEKLIREALNKKVKTDVPVNYVAILTGDADLKIHLGDIEKYMKYTPKTSNLDEANFVDDATRKDIKDKIEATIKNKRDQKEALQTEINALKKVEEALKPKAVEEDVDFEDVDDMTMES